MPAIGSRINHTDIVNSFVNAVVTPILSGAAHSGNPPMKNGYQCVPSRMLDHYNNVTKAPAGLQNSGNNTIDAEFLRDALITIVRNLTRVGTYSWVLYMKYLAIVNGRVEGTPQTKPGNYTSGNRLVASQTGKCIFTTAYIRENYNGPTNIHNVSLNNLITADDINNFLTEIYNSWYYSDRHHHNGQVILCHEECHYNCHDDCHGNCNNSCHAWD
jgi:hypothetical protein